MTITSTAQDLFRQYSFQEKFFHPPPPKPKQHPLYKAMEKSQKKGRKQNYFVEREAGSNSSSFVQEMVQKATVADDAARECMHKLFRASM